MVGAVTLDGVAPGARLAGDFAATGRAGVEPPVAFVGVAFLADGVAFVPATALADGLAGAFLAGALLAGALLAGAACLVDPLLAAAFLGAAG